METGKNPTSQHRGVSGDRGQKAERQWRLIVADVDQGLVFRGDRGQKAERQWRPTADAVMVP